MPEQSPLYLPLSGLSRPSPRAFSLIELLVVIAIMAVLAALGFSWARSAMERANVSKCASNLRQLATAATSYAADNRGMLPWMWCNRHGVRIEDRGWFSLLAPYIGASVKAVGSFPRVGDGSGPEKCLICPAHPKMGVGGIMTTNIGYGWNALGIWLVDNKYSSVQGSQLGSSTAIAAIPQPAKTVMISCAGPGVVNPYAAGPTNFTRPNGSVVTYPSWVGPHGGKANAVFCDGHVKFMQMTNTGPAGNPTERGLLDEYWWRVNKL
jgi:prepilin-type N-terminal cleavage/methylation domain-containing protein/prepilin-type processing-associated H-X9-DG protein